MTQPATVSKYLYYFEILSKTTPPETKGDIDDRAKECQEQKTET